MGVSWVFEGRGRGATYFIDAVDPEILEGGVAGDLLGGERGDEGDDRGGLHDVRVDNDTE